MLASWPTPNSGPQNDSDSTWQERRAELKETHKNGNGFGLTLGMAASLASWPTPNTPSGGRSMSTEKMDATGRTLDGKKHTASLEHAAKFAGWATPKVGTGKYQYANGDKTRPVLNLEGQADLATASGQTPSGLPVPTGSRGQLNPAHSRWLQGYAIAWDYCGAMVTRLSRKRRQK
jgi:hypothetical protein